MPATFLRGLLAVLLLSALGCKEEAGASGGTSGVALYAFDSTASRVLVWSDLNAVYDTATGTTPDPTYQITSSLFSKVTTLAWGGLVMDSQRGLLYLVSETGDIVRVARVRSQSGAVATVDITSFHLASESRLTNAKFGQVALDIQNDQLFVTETGDSSTRIWVVSSASSQAQDANIALSALQVSGDSGGTGVAAGAGAVYAFMLDGSPVGMDALTGPRLRKGTSGGFDTAQVIVGNATTLGKYGSLALDRANGYLFAARHATDSGSSAPPVLAFRTGQFGLSYNQAPATTLGSATDQPDLRVLSHPGTKDWLVGLRGQGTVAFGTLHLWKSPLSGAAAKTFTVSPSGSVIRGVAIDGNAS